MINYQHNPDGTTIKNHPNTNIGQKTKNKESNFKNTEDIRLRKVVKQSSTGKTRTGAVTNLFHPLFSSWPARTDFGDRQTLTERDVPKHTHKVRR